MINTVELKFKIDIARSQFIYQSNIACLSSPRMLCQRMVDHQGYSKGQYLRVVYEQNEKIIYRRNISIELSISSFPLSQ